MPTEIGSFEAKTRFSEILRKVDEGEQFTVTLRGRPVADIVPTRSGPSKAEVARAVENLRNFPKVQGISGDEVLEWVREGRK